MKMHTTNLEPKASAFWILSERFFLAGIELRQRSRFGKLDTPCYYLFGHSMELSLKAYLRGKEYSLEVLKASARKNGFGHDLSKLLDESRRRKVGREVKLNRNDMWVIRFVDDMYKHKEFEYGYVGTRQMPKLELVEAVARKLVSGLKDYCYRKSGLKHETSTVPPAKDAFLAVTAEQSCLPISREENQ